MTPKRIQETWDSFWGDLLLRRFHEVNPERWSAREEKADWIIKTLALPAGAKIVDLGCGDGLLDICLARKGYLVTAIDRIASVVNAARGEASAIDVDVSFVAADLRTYELSSGKYDAAILFDALGLMSRNDELNILNRLRSALHPSGHILMDWPATCGHSQWERVFSDGILKVSAEYDKATRLQTILPEFHHNDGQIIELHDAFSLPDYIGIHRHIYALEEAQSLLAEAGFESRNIRHYRTESYYMLDGNVKPGS